MAIDPNIEFKAIIVTLTLFGRKRFLLLANCEVDGTGWVIDVNG